MLIFLARHSSSVSSRTWTVLNATLGTRGHIRGADPWDACLKRSRSSSSPLSDLMTMRFSVGATAWLWDNGEGLPRSKVGAEGAGEAGQDTPERLNARLCRPNKGGATNGLTFEAAADAADMSRGLCRSCCRSAGASCRFRVATACIVRGRVGCGPLAGGS